MTRRPLVNLSHVASAEGYRPVVRVTAKARSDPRTRPVGMLGAEGFWRVKRLRSVGTIHIKNDFHGFGRGRGGRGLSLIHI